MNQPVRISELPAAQPLAGDEFVPIVQDGQTRKALARDLGGAGALGGRTHVVSFGFGDASPTIVFTTGAASIVHRVTAHVTTAFDGLGARFDLGTVGAPSALFPGGAADLAEAGEYGFHPSLTMSAGTGLQLSITPGSGATRGAALLVIEIANL